MDPQSRRAIEEAAWRGPPKHKDIIDAEVIRDARPASLNRVVGRVAYGTAFRLMCLVEGTFDTAISLVIFAINLGLLLSVAYCMFGIPFHVMTSESATMTVSGVAIDLAVSTAGWAVGIGWILPWLRQSWIRKKIYFMKMESVYKDAND